MPVAEETKTEFTTDEAIEYLGVSRNTFFKYLRAHEFAPNNLNVMLERQPNPRYSKADLDAFVKRRRAEKAPPQTTQQS